MQFEQTTYAGDVEILKRKPFEDFINNEFTQSL